MTATDRTKEKTARIKTGQIWQDADSRHEKTEDKYRYLRLVQGTTKGGEAAFQAERVVRTAEGTWDPMKDKPRPTIRERTLRAKYRFIEDAPKQGTAS